MLDAGTDYQGGKACGFLRRVVFFLNYLRKEKKAPAYFGPIFTPSLINLNFAWRLAGFSHRKPHSYPGPEPWAGLVSGGCWR